jgi:hypothetical protein
MKHNWNDNEIRSSWVGLALVMMILIELVFHGIPMIKNFQTAAFDRAWLLAMEQAVGFARLLFGNALDWVMIPLAVLLGSMDSNTPVQFAGQFLHEWLKQPFVRLAGLLAIVSVCGIIIARSYIPLVCAHIVVRVYPRASNRSKSGREGG